MDSFKKGQGQVALLDGHIDISNLSTYLTLTLSSTLDYREEFTGAMSAVQNIDSSDTVTVSLNY